MRPGIGETVFISRSARGDRVERIWLAAMRRRTYYERSVSTCFRTFSLVRHPHGCPVLDSRRRADGRLDSAEPSRPSAMTNRTLHRLGVISGLAAGVWMGASEVPARLVSTSYSPYLVS